MLGTGRGEILVRVRVETEVSEGWKLRQQGFRPAEATQTDLILASSIRVQGCFSHMRIIIYSQKPY